MCINLLDVLTNNFKFEMERFLFEDKIARRRLNEKNVNFIRTERLRELNCLYFVGKI